MRKPTGAQAQLIRYFADGTKPTMRITQQTYARCEAEGWIVRTDVFPYHVATGYGREAIDMLKEEIDAEFVFIADYNDAGQPEISHLVASNGDIFVTTKENSTGMPKKHTVFSGLSRAKSVDIVNKFRAVHLEVQHSEALQMNRDRVWMYRKDLVDRTVYVEGSQIFLRVGPWRRPELFEWYDSPETAMAVLKERKAEYMANLHQQALDMNAVRDADLDDDACYWARMATGDQ